MQGATAVLDARQERILRFVVEQFTQSGAPVGSRLLAKLKDEHLSPASIRNTMADLEDMGLLAQPHTSAGRLPTDKGYRYYIDSLMPSLSLPTMELHEIESYFDNYRGMISSILEVAPQVLSRFSNYIGIATTPRIKSMVLKHLQFIRQDAQRVLVLFVSNNGMVFNKLIRVERDYSQSELDKLSRWVVAHFAGLNFYSLRRRVDEMLQEERARYDEMANKALILSRDSFEGGFEQQELKVGGIGKFVVDSGKQLQDRMKEILKTIEHRSGLLDLIDQVMVEGSVQVIIGSETELEEIKGCSLVASTYNFPDGSFGNIAILGPTHMPYPRTVYLVDYISKQISRFAG